MVIVLAVGTVGAMSAMFYLRYTSRESPPEISAAGVSAESSLDNVHLVQREVGKVRWELSSKKVDAYNEESYVDLEGVDLLIFTAADERLQVFGDRGRYSQDSRDVWVSGNVKVLYGNDYVLYSDTLHWDIDGQTMKADGAAKAEGPNGSITGKGMTIDVRRQKIYIKKNVTAQLN